MPTTADGLWNDEWSDLAGSEGLLNAATGIAFGIALGLCAWALIGALVWVAVH